MTTTHLISRVVTLCILLSHFAESASWIWTNGLSTVDNPPQYDENVTTPAIGSRYSPLSWVDSKGNGYIYGGYGLDSNSSLGALADLWMWSGSSWTFIHGSETRDTNPNYGQKLVPSNSNTPGDRTNAITWVDAFDHLWLFGGDGPYNDMWFWDGTGWNWVSGTNGTGAPGTYGTLGVPSRYNYAGARNQAASWYDKSNRFLYIFGGEGVAADGSTGLLNDMWNFTGASWTWIGGSNATAEVGTYNSSGLYYPGARRASCTWTDASGNLWLFGGIGLTTSSSSGLLQDLWKFNTQSKTWTFVSGSDVLNAPGNYGTQSVSSPSNMPGGRSASQCWAIGGKLYLFGGFGYGSNGTSAGYLNDLWVFDTSDESWEWLSGSDTVDSSGDYNNDGNGFPGGRQSSSFWSFNGILYLFGGFGFGSAGSFGELSDLWQFYISSSPSAVTTGAVITTGAFAGTTNGVVGTGSGSIISNTTSSTGEMTSSAEGFLRVSVGVSLLGALLASL